MKATIAICSYNGSARIGAVLHSLSAQSFDHHLWEVLVIDNASKDDTGEISARIIRDQLGGRGRVVREPEPGLSFARARAAREAAGEVLIFLDDDNVPAPDFIANVIQAFAERPRAGIIGGKVLPCWETKPTPLAETVAPFALAICDLGNLPKQMDISGGCGIVGAGLCVRRPLLREIFSSPALAGLVTDRQGTNLISGGDLAISVVAGQMGWECWYVPALEIKHLLPPGRMAKPYLLRLYEGIGRGQAAVRQCSDWKARSPLAWLVGLKDLARWQLGEWRGPSPALRRQHPELARDLHELNQNLVLGRARQAMSWPN